MKRILVGSREDVRRFSDTAPHAIISFVGYRHKRSAPRLPPHSSRVARIIIRADDTYPEREGSVALTERQAERIARFVHKVAGKIDTLFTQCTFGHGRSCGAAIAIARAFGLPWQEYLDEERVGNGHVTRLLADAFKRLGYDCGAGDSAAYDFLYALHLERSSG